MDAAGPFLPFPGGQKAEGLPEEGEDCTRCHPQDAFPLSSEITPGMQQDPTELTDGSNWEENVTFISESMTVTSSDEEKLQLLNKNTELRRLNKELLKLNQEWDRIYHATSQGLQQEVGALQQEVVSLQKQMERLSIKLEHEQEKREYSEQTLLQELRKNQHLQEFIRHLESKLHRRSSSERRIPANTEGQRRSSQSEDIVDRQHLHHGLSCSEMPVQAWEEAGKVTRCSKPAKTRFSKPQQEPSQALQLESPVQEKAITELKEQLQALKCQTEIFKADYKSEHQDRQRITAENEHLRKKEEDMRQQMLLLQEQLKIYEDDFRKERSDKQVLQRLLKSKSNPKDPLLVHRCNNEHHEKPAAVLPARMPVASAPAANRERHSHKRSECPKYRQLRDAEVQASPFSIDYK